METSFSAYANAVTVRPVPEPVQYLWWVFVLGISISSLSYLPFPRLVIIALASLVMLLVLEKARLSRRHHRCITSVTIGADGRIETQLTEATRQHAFASTQPTGRRIDASSPTLYRAGVFIVMGQYHRSVATWTVCHSAGATREQRKRLRLFLLDPRFSPVLSPARQPGAATVV